MSRVKFLLTAVMGVVVTISASNMFAQECCDSGNARGGRVGIFARMRANRAYTNNNNCCATPAQDCCATPAPCCQTAAPCCQTQTACCSAPSCGSCNTCQASHGCCRTGMVRSFRARGCDNCAYTSHNNCCGTTTGCSSCGGCAGCAGGQIIQGSSEGVVVPEASGQPTAPSTPTPSDT